jgi:hypothetical protein
MVRKMDVVYGAAVIAGALFLFSTSTTFKTFVPESVSFKNLRKYTETNASSPNLDVRKCQAVEEIQAILIKNGKQNEVLLDSMNLMLYQLANPDVDLSQLVPVDGGHMVEIGKNYLSRFASVAGTVFYFLTGVIENEVENIRLDVDVMYMDKQSIRKLVDLFYYKELIK